MTMTQQPEHLKNEILKKTRGVHDAVVTGVNYVESLSLLSCFISRHTV